MELDGQGRQVLVELGREGQQIVALVGQRADDRADAMRAERLARPQFGDDEVDTIRTRVAWSGPASERMSWRSQSANIATSAAKAMAWASAWRARLQLAGQALGALPAPSRVWPSSAPGRLRVAMAS